MAPQTLHPNCSQTEQRQPLQGTAFPHRKGFLTPPTGMDSLASPRTTLCGVPLILIVKTTPLGGDLTRYWDTWPMKKHGLGLGKPQKASTSTEMDFTPTQPLSRLSFCETNSGCCSGSSIFFLPWMLLPSYNTRFNWAAFFCGELSWFPSSGISDAGNTPVSHLCYKTLHWSKVWFKTQQSRQVAPRETEADIWTTLPLQAGKERCWVVCLQDVRVLKKITQCES